jgi:hypothetical protein
VCVVVALLLPRAREAVNQHTQTHTTDRSIDQSLVNRFDESIDCQVKQQLPAATKKR